MEGGAMGTQQWSDDIVIAELADEPALSDELASLCNRIEKAPAGKVPHVVLNLAGVSYVGSSNIGQLLLLRRVMGERQRVLKLCSVSDQVWSIFLVTGIDKLFRFAPDPMTALAGIQLEETNQ
jgi:anti-anti-sigma factor